MNDKKLEIVLAAKDMTERAFSRFSARMGSLTKAVFSFKGALAGLGVGFGIKKIGEDFLDVAESFEQMELKLNALTKGKGKETLEALNKWALDMPVNTRKVVDTFTMMMAMGLDPTIEKMETLVDTSVIFGEDALPRVARALGQMKTLGKLSAEELNQLSEAGINARKYLIDAFGMGVEELKKSEIEIERIIQAIMDGLKRDFGGAAKDAMNNWQGLKATTASYIDEIERRVMAAGIFDELKKQLRWINDELKAWIDNNDELIRQKVPEYIGKTKDKIKDIKDIYDSLPEGVVGAAGIGLIGRILFASGKAGFVAGSMYLINSELEKFKNKIKDLTSKAWQKAWPINPFQGGSAGRLSGAGGGFGLPTDFETWETEMLPSLFPEETGIGGITRKKLEKAKTAFRDYSREILDLFLETMNVEAWQDRSDQIVAIHKNVWERMVQDAENWEPQLLDLSLEAMRPEYWEENLNKIKELTKNIFDKDMKNAVMGWASSWSHTLTDMFWESDWTFKGIGKSFGKMLTQMLFQKKIIEPFLNFGFGMMGGSTGTSASAAGSSGVKVQGTGTSKMGGAPAYAGMPNVLINITNKGQPVTARQMSGPRFDGKQYVLDVMIDDQRKRGPVSQGFLNMRP